MGSIVWVLMTVSSHSWASPTLAFATQEQCVVALEDIKTQSKLIRSDVWVSGYCVKVKGAL
jgi:hypothetical protein